MPACVNSWRAGICMKQDNAQLAASPKLLAKRTSFLNNSHSLPQWTESWQSAQTLIVVGKFWTLKSRVWVTHASQIVKNKELVRWTICLYWKLWSGFNPLRIGAHVMNTNDPIFQHQWHTKVLQFIKHVLVCHFVLSTRRGAPIEGLQ